MVRYIGSKLRHAKWIMPIILKDHKPDTIYIEPFVGGGNMISQISPNVGRRIGYDTNQQHIGLLKAIRDGWEPPSILSEDEYKDIKNNKEDYPDYLVGFVGFSCSYAGKFFGGYARNAIGTNYADQQRKSLLRQAIGLKGCEFHVSDYRNIAIPGGCTVYCDPPYQNTIKYSNGEFSHEEFYQWCLEHANNARIFVSEYSKPPIPHKKVGQKQTHTKINAKAGGQGRTEKLFQILGE